MGVTRIRGGLAVLCIAALTGCGGSIGPIDLPNLGAGSKDIPLENYSARDIFARGEYELETGKPEDAARYFVLDLPPASPAPATAGQAG